MKKILCAFCMLITCFNTIQSFSQLQNEIYNQEIEKLSTQLKQTAFLPQEKRDLIIKLTNYFNNEDGPVVDNKKTNVLYASIIRSYYKLLRISKSLAENFQDQVIGKIWRHKNNFFI